MAVDFTIMGLIPAICKLLAVSLWLEGLGRRQGNGKAWGGGGVMRRPGEEAG